MSSSHYLRTASCPTTHTFSSKGWRRHRASSASPKRRSVGQDRCTRAAAMGPSGRRATTSASYARVKTPSGSQGTSWKTLSGHDSSLRHPSTPFWAPMFGASAICLVRSTERRVQGDPAYAVERLSAGSEGTRPTRSSDSAPGPRGPGLRDRATQRRVQGDPAYGVGRASCGSMKTRTRRGLT